MAKNYADVSRAIVASLGGLTNIEAVTHCMTRLRFVLRDAALIDNATLKAIPGVMGVVSLGVFAFLAAAMLFGTKLFSAKADALLEAEKDEDVESVAPGH